MIEIYLKYDNMHTIGVINAFIYINNHVNSLINPMLSTFMSKYEDEAMELIETVGENSHHNASKLLERGAMPKGQMIDAKSAETGMLLE